MTSTASRSFQTLAAALACIVVAACAPGGASQPDAAVGPARLGGGTECDLMALAHDLAHAENETPPVDCGVALLSDPESTWIAVSDCLVANLAAQTAFVGGWELLNNFEPDILAYAYVGIAGPPFVLRELHYDSDPSGGFNPNTPPRTVLHQCVNYGERDACTPSVGGICMGCFDPTRPDLVDLCPGWN